MTVQQQGIDESAWLAGLPPFPDQPVERVVAVAARPEDAVLGVSGLLQQLHDRGAHIDLVVAADDGTDELPSALAAEGLSDVTVHRLGLPASGLLTHRTVLAEQLVDLVRDAEVCLAPWPGESNADQRTVGEVALQVAPITTHRWSYPVRRTSPDRLPRASAYAHRLDGTRRRRKAAGIAAFTSQPAPGTLGRGCEVLFRHPRHEGAPLSRFVDLYGAADDPWHVATSWYEQRKQGIALASLPRQRYGTVVEPACGIGALTRALAARCDRLVAFDPVAAAVRRCRARTEHLPNVTVELGILPGGMPAGPADLVVFSEILYYLGDADLKTTVDQTVAALRPGGHILAVHWLPWAADAPRDGMAAHRKLLAHPCVDRVVEHVDE
ncbi:MAG TPA: SAM-dependent methyltransferase, partial [Pseudonocardiaceae bacterium]|nr:SAM-dependent methyltransferase [Pseudonocardiaceae bacterium]